MTTIREVIDELYRLALTVEGDNGWGGARLSARLRLTASELTRLDKKIELEVFNGANGRKRARSNRPDTRG